jgi:hypothetical protein
LEGEGYDEERRGKENIYVVKKGEKQGVGRGLSYVWSQLREEGRIHFGKYSIWIEI